ncbi:MAG: VRR-NUC domain-containing protein, partial [Rickettsiales bacterium]|nr:VRR-NUC domain-containing protein [Rickettsiales bacterium]
MNYEEVNLNKLVQRRTDEVQVKGVYRKKRKNFEEQIQKSIVDYCKLTNIFCFAVPNGEARASYVNGVYDYRSAMIKGNKLKAQGVVPGVSDLIVIHNNKVIFIEVKTDKGVQSEQQKEFEARCKENKQEYHLVRSLEDFQNIFKKRNTLGKIFFLYIV